MRRIGVGSDTDFAHLIGPFHERGEGLRRDRTDERDFPCVDRAITAIERDPIAFAHHAVVRSHAFLFGVDFQFLGAHDAALPPSARDHGGVAGLATRGREDALGDEHAADILRACLAANENHPLAARCPCFGIPGGEDGFADGSSRDRINAGGDSACGKFVARERGIEDGIEETLDIFGLDPFKCFFKFYEALILHVHGHLESGSRRTLSGARLEHVELAVFDREFHVLHVAIVLFEFFAHPLELLIDLGHQLGHFFQMERRADARDHVFALRVDEEVTEENLLASGRVAREANAGARIVSGIAKYHLDYVDGSAEEGGNFFDAAVGDGFFAHPGFKDRANRAPELFLGIFGERLAGLLFVVLLVFADELPPTLRGNVGIVLHLQIALQRAETIFKLFLGQTNNHRRIHLH